MVKLIELLTEEEIKIIKDQFSTDFKTDIFLYEMTIKQLSYIACILYKTDYGHSNPVGFLSAEAIKILSNRAIRKNLPIY